jgi:hypothetical protein
VRTATNLVLVTADFILPSRPPEVQPHQPDGRPTRAQLIGAIKRARPVYKLDYYWCLTLQIDVCAPGEAHAYAMRYWNRLRRDLARKHGTFDFICIPEQTSRGYTHLNVYSSLHLSQQELSDAWRIATQGRSYMVRTARVRPGRLEEYVTKQMDAASINPSSAPVNPRRWSTSRSIRLQDLIPATRARAPESSWITLF